MSVRISAPCAPFGHERGRGIAGRDWTMGCAAAWDQARDCGANPVLDLSNVGFMPLFEWLTAVAQMETIVSRNFTRKARIDPVGEHSDLFIGPESARRERDRLRRGLEVDAARLTFSEPVHKLMGFIDSLRTLPALNRPGSERGAVEYNVPARGFYSSEASPTLVLGTTRIEDADSCRQFLDRGLIRKWRDRMDTRFSASPLFESDLTWRVFCHELATNIVEHAGPPGFLAARVVEPRDGTGEILDWVRATWPDCMEVIEETELGFLEICVVDMGPGIVSTLGDAYRCDIMRRGLCVPDAIRSEDVLAFAFDEFATSKADVGKRLSDVHALGRILQLVSRFGGLVNLRSSGVEISYVSRMQWFTRFRDRPGYEPTHVRPTDASLPGTQVQVLLPLVPRNGNRAAPDPRPALERSLPRGFRTESDKPLGQFLPLEACDLADDGVGSVEQLGFRDKCRAAFGRILANRSRSEALVISFNGVEWGASQFDIFMEEAQNWIQHRPVLLVEMPVELVSEIADQEDVLNLLEGYKDPGCVVLAVDTQRERYLLGLRDPICERALLELVSETPTSLEMLLQRFPEANERVLNRMLTHANPLFEMVDGGWRCVWTDRMIASETSRALVEHFDSIADAHDLWAAKRLASQNADPEAGGPPHAHGPAKRLPAFNLPWQSQWKTDFLESSRMLSRERLADEAALYLIDRLRRYLSGIGGSLEDVAVLACVTTPAILLATAMRKWWPVSDPADRPTVADFGYYLMLKHRGGRPSIDTHGNAVIVQDILDSGEVSAELVSFLSDRHVPILCTVALVQLTSDVESTRLNPVDGEWTLSRGGVPTHSMLSVRRPAPASEDGQEPSGAELYWIEPKTLRPVSYDALRRQLVRRASDVLRLMDREGLLVQGHYVYGTRHYGVVVNIPRLVASPIGDEIAAWLADVCEGVPYRERAKDWDSGGAADGPVNIVLMPLHSQIHLLWSKVERLLAHRDVRQLAWLLDATLFSGRGPAYRLPAHVLKHIESAVYDSWVLRQSCGVGSDLEVIDRPLRILVLDDDIATTRTAETILTTIHDRVRASYKALDSQFDEHPSQYHRPIAWVRYFSILNQMGYERNTLWHRALEFREPRLPVVMGEYAPFIGTPVYTEHDCPACQEQRRLSRTVSLYEDIPELADVVEWAKERLQAVQTIAVDVPELSTKLPATMTKPIPVTGDAERSADWPLHADTAIWQFHELMYRSYPPSDALRVLSSIDEGEYSADMAEYARFEWAVMEWCLRNWPRVKAEAAQGYFLCCFRRLLNRNSSTVERVLEAATEHYEEPFVQDLVRYCQDELAKTEAERDGSACIDNPVKRSRALILKRSLDLFWFGVPHQARDLERGSLRHLLAEMDGLIRGMGVAARDSHIGLLYRTIERSKTRPRANPDWALYTTAECLYRGRRSSYMLPGHHRLLPYLLYTVIQSPKDPCARSLLKGNLLEFMSALLALSEYYPLDGLEHLLQRCRDASDVLRRPDACSGADELKSLFQSLDRHGTFCASFDEQLHRPLGDLLGFTARDRRYFESQVSWQVDQNGCDDYRILAPWRALCDCIANFTLQPARDYRRKDQHHSLVKAIPSSREGKPQNITLRLLTTFADPATTAKRILKSGNNAANRYMLETFGVRLGDPTTPCGDDSCFACSMDIAVPTGFWQSKGGAI